MNLIKLEKILADERQPNFRLEQVMKAVYGDGVASFSEITNIPKKLSALLDRKIKILSVKEDKVLLSQDKKSIKARLLLSDGNRIETVLLAANSGIWSACISSQAGCPMSCAFCATGFGGLKRNLTAEEISDQVLFWKQFIRKKKLSGRLSNIVFMGMGEPFLNWEAVKESLKTLADKKLLNFGSRSISISTVGISGSIKKMAAFPQINLAISLHFCDNIKRSRFMPANRSYNLERLKADLSAFFSRSNRKVFLEYILFHKINDSVEEARKLAQFINSFKKPRLLHVNLIRYNRTSVNDLFKPSCAEQTLKFKAYLLRNGINCTVRKSLGADIQGACGQLTGLEKYY